MSTKKEEPQKIRLLGITKEAVGDGWAQASSLSEYEISHEMFLKHCRRISKTEPDVIGTLYDALQKKAREMLGF